MLFDKMPREVGFNAFTDATVLRKDVDDVIQFILDEPKCMYSLLDELTTSTERIATLNTGPAEQRIVKWLYTLMSRFGHLEDNHVVLSLGMTIQEFADGIRLSRESAGKILNNLENEGVIVMGHRRMIIYPEKLEVYTEHLSSPRSTLSISGN
jgi:CRP-like cAMP-binding protein